MNPTARRWVPALDTDDLQQALRLVGAVDRHPSVYGYKLGFALGLTHGLAATVWAIRRISEKPIVYDHQKAGTDIPDTAPLFARTTARCGVDEVIVFPQAGPASLAAFVSALQAEGRKVIVGGVMTHERYLASEGGWLSDEGMLDAYRQAAAMGVEAFVVPLTKPERVRAVMDTLGADRDWEFYSPGLGTQGGSADGLGALPRHHVIVGRSLLRAPDPLAYLQRLEAPGGAQP
jgi:orotidine-5'-phosphate decarboxylase